MDKITDFKIFICFIILLLLGMVISLKYCNKQQDIINMHNAINDSLVKVKNKDSTETATIALMQASNAKLILELQTTNQEIKNLQDEVRKYKDKIKNGGSITNHTTVTNYYNSTNTYTTLENGFVVYNGTNKDKTWIDWTSKATKDSTSLKLKVINAYSIIIGEEKQGLFKKPKPIVEVINKNPYSSTTSLRAFEVKDNTSNKRFGLGVQGGVGITMFGFTPYLGIGVSYNLIKW